MSDAGETRGRVCAEWLRPVQTDFTYPESRTRLLLAISDAERMGFTETRQSLVEILLSLETAHGDVGVKLSQESASEGVVLRHT